MIEPDVAETAPSAASGHRRAQAATLADIERIEELTLEDFELDLSSVVFPQVPAGERLSDRDLRAGADISWPR